MFLLVLDLVVLRTFCKLGKWRTTELHLQGFCLIESHRAAQAEMTGICHHAQLAAIVNTGVNRTYCDATGAGLSFHPQALYKGMEKYSRSGRKDSW